MRQHLSNEQTASQVLALAPATREDVAKTKRWRKSSGPGLVEVPARFSRLVVRVQPRSRMASKL